MVLGRTAKEFRENVLSRHFYDNHKFPGVRTILARAGLAPVTHLTGPGTGEQEDDGREKRSGAEERREDEKRNKLSGPLMKQI